MVADRQSIDRFPVAARGLRWAMAGRTVHVLAALVSGALAWFAVGLHPIWWVAWLAPIPVLIAAYRGGAWEAAGLGLLTGLVAAGSRFSESMSIGGLPPAILTFAILGVLWSLTIWLARGLARATAGWGAGLAYPLAWAATDTALSILSPHGTMGSLAYSQMDALPVIQTAALFGVPGVVFVMSIFASIVAVAASGLGRERPFLTYGLPAGLLVAALAYGGLRLAQPYAPTTIRVGLAALDRPEQPTKPDQPDPIWRRYLPQIDQLAQEGARVVVLPEAISILDAGQQQSLASQLGALAKQRSIYIVAGLGAQDGPLLHNTVWVFGPTGERIARYWKEHLVPGFEATHVTPGKSLTTFALAGHPVGLAICKDMDFPDLARAYAARDVQALIVPGADSGLDGWLHARMAVLRGVEDGFSILHSAQYGMMTVSDPFGRVREEAYSRTAPGAAMVVDAPIGPRKATVYSGVGHLFGLFSIFAVFAGFGVALVRRRLRPPAADPQS